MILNQLGWHYIALRKPSALDKEQKITNVIIIACIVSFVQGKNKLKLHKKTCKNKAFCCVSMRSGGNMILGFSQYQKSVKLPFIICANYESLIVKVD